MLLFPYEKVTYHTKISPDEVVQRISNVLDNRPRWFFSPVNHNKPYRGKVEAHTFSIRRIIGYGNPFLPRISGTVIQYETDSQVELSLRVHPLALLFMVALVACLGFMGWSSFQEIGVKFSEDRVFYPFLLIPISYVLMLIGFKIEAHKSELYFRDLLDAIKK